MAEIRSSEEWSSKLVLPLYKEGYIQTLWNITDAEKRKEGWTLVSGLWSPWYFNMRPMGSSPELFFNVCQAMSDLVLPLDIDLLVGIEMAGVGLASATVVSSIFRHNRPIPYGYTRPLPQKARDPEAVVRILGEIDPEPFMYGQKSFVEAILKDGLNVAVCDDMAMNLGSKIVARQIVLWTAEKLGVEVSCNQVVYFLNRNRENKQKGLDFGNSPQKELRPEPLDVYYVMEFNDYLQELSACMTDAEYDIISSYQKDPNLGKDEKFKKEALELAAKGK